MHGLIEFIYNTHETQQYCHDMTTTYPIFNTNSERYLYGPQVVTNDFRNLIKPFPLQVWLLVLISTLSIASLFLIIHGVYNLFPEINLIDPKMGKRDLLFKTIGALTEPDQIRGFKGVNTGALSVPIPVVTFSCL